MKTRQEIETIIGGYRENERPPKIAEALLEVMLDIREALLNLDDAKEAYRMAFAEVDNQLKEQQMEGIKESVKTELSTHPGWTCDDAHPNMTHAQWLGTGQEQPNGLDAADQQDHTEVEYP